MRCKSWCRSMRKSKCAEVGAEGPLLQEKVQTERAKFLAPAIHWHPQGVSLRAARKGQGQGVLE